MKNSRSLLLVALCVSLFAFPASSDVDVGGVVKIEIGKNRGVSQSELWQRVWMLERAVSQLQARVFQLEGRPWLGTNPVIVNPTNPATMSTCYLKTPFNGTFTATEATETAAKAKVLAECGDKTSSSIHCDEDKVKCGK